MTAGEIYEFMTKLESEGYAVIVWTPEELSGVSVEEMEEKSIQYVWWLIAAIKENDNV